MKLSEKILERKQSGVIPIIPDFKRISPKDGNLFGQIDPIEAAKKLEALGAPAISVVTENRDFGGCLSLLEEIVSAVSIPVLRKDFIHSVQDIEETVNTGASAVLLICSCMTTEELTACYHASLAYGLEPLVEAHTREELLLAHKLQATLVGINNREIQKLERDNGTVSLTKELISYAPQNSVVISESGILTPADALTAFQAGASAVLVGTALWKADDMYSFYSKLSKGVSP